MENDDVIDYIYDLPLEMSCKIVEKITEIADVIKILEDERMGPLMMEYGRTLRQLGGFKMYNINLIQGMRMLSYVDENILISVKTVLEANMLSTLAPGVSVTIVILSDNFTESLEIAKAVVDNYLTKSITKGSVHRNMRIAFRNIDFDISDDSGGDFILINKNKMLIGTSLYRDVALVALSIIKNLDIQMVSVDHENIKGLSLIVGNEIYLNTDMIYDFSRSDLGCLDQSNSPKLKDTILGFNGTYSEFPDRLLTIYMYNNGLFLHREETDEFLLTSDTLIHRMIERDEYINGNKNKGKIDTTLNIWSSSKNYESLMDIFAKTIFVNSKDIMIKELTLIKIPLEFLNAHEMTDDSIHIEQSYLEIFEG
ncbi:MAG: hypothetical protein COA94_03045 [Rickettsiales bacterium]|nr:MAG: hypothetical protein COA94_03045 [Rickettsiales bacterium]